jgi:hypothetical protein
VSRWLAYGATEASQRPRGGPGPCRDAWKTHVVCVTVHPTAEQTRDRVRTRRGLEPVDLGSRCIAERILYRGAPVL